MGATRISGGFIDLKEILTPSNPATDVGRLYFKDLAGITTPFVIDSVGAETNLLLGGAGGGSGFTVVKKTADESVTNSATFQDDDELKFSAEANSTYFVRVKGIAFSAGSNGDLRNTWSVPSGATGVHANRLLAGQDLLPLGISIMTALSDISDGDFIEPTAIITIGSTAGEVALSWAQNLTNATPTTVKKGTILEFVKVA